jgi:molybdopterin-guanine dinucleotide biosynthesis protein A
MATSAIVLAGGQGRRIGAEKHLLEIGGRSLMEIAVARVSVVSDDVIVVASPTDSASTQIGGARVISDVVPGKGPLSGLHAGLRVAKFDRALLVACDMPFLSESLLHHLVETATDADAVVPQIADDLEPLLAVYSRACLPVVEGLLSRESASMRDLLEDVRVHLVPEEEVRRFDREGCSWFNINTPDDADRARALWNELEDSE